MFVSEIMSKCVAECTEDAGLEEVYELIRKCEHGLVVVVDSHAHRVPIGIVNERSICDQIIIRGRNPRTLFAGAVMDSRIKCVTDTDLVEGIDIADRATTVIVTDRSRKVCGLIPVASLSSASRAANREVETSLPDDLQPSRTVSEMPAFGWVQ